MNIKTYAHFWARGASEAENDKGTDAAHLVLEDVDHELAFTQILLKAGDEPHDEALADLWDKAEMAACKAAFEDWDYWPEDEHLTVDGVADALESQYQEESFAVTNVNSLQRIAK
jgi:hypothetical protein